MVTARTGFTETDLVKELTELARPSTEVRMKFNKWASVEKVGFIEGEKPYEIKPERGIDYAYIRSPKPNYILGFPLANINSRLKLKRTSVVFSGINTIWRMVNPFARKGVGRAVYKCVLSTFYLTVIKSLEGLPTAETIISEYVAADFGSKSAINYTEFYNRLFVCVDTSTKSKLVSEYVRVLSKLAEAINESTWIQTQKLHLHNDPGDGKSYEGWMRPYLVQTTIPSGFDSRFHFKDTPEPTAAKKSSLSPHGPTQKELPLLRTSLRHIDVLLKSQPRKKRPRHHAMMSDASVKTLTSRIGSDPDLTHKNINRFKYLEHLEVISPLSTLPRVVPPRRDLVEEIVQVRATHSTRLYPGTQTARA